MHAHPKGALRPRRIRAAHAILEDPTGVSDESSLTDTDATSSEAIAALASRRSRRSRPMDVDRKLMVVMPDENPLGVTLEELQDGGSEEDMEHVNEPQLRILSGSKRVPSISVPTVKKSSTTSAHVGGFERPQGMLPSHESVRGTEYDANSDDEAFVNSVNTDLLSNRKKPSKRPRTTQSDSGAKTQDSTRTLTLDAFENMIEVLERELRLALHFDRSRREVARQHQRLTECSRTCLETVESLRHNLDRTDSTSLQRAAHSALHCLEHFNAAPSVSGPEPYAWLDVAQEASDSIAAEERGASTTTFSRISAAFTLRDVTFLVPKERAFRLLRAVWNSHDNGHVADGHVEHVLKRVYEYWADTVVKSSCSKLRCFHKFIMDNWSPQGTMPYLPDDENSDAMAESYNKLLALRYDLEKARLLLDCMRKREKTKRDMIKLGEEGLDALLTLPERTNELKKAVRFQLQAMNDEGQSVAKVTEPTQVAPLHLKSTKPLKRSTSLSMKPELRPVMHSGPRPASGPGRGPSGNNSAHVWGLEEDRLLLIGVALHGVGRWADIRRDMQITRNSAQMNQRFARLLRRRSFELEGSPESGDPPAAEHSKVDESRLRALLRVQRPDILERLGKFDEAAVWEEIAKRTIEASMSETRRSGRPAKTPVHVPLPPGVFEKIKSAMFAPAIVPHKTECSPARQHPILDRTHRRDNAHLLPPAQVHGGSTAVKSSSKRSKLSSARAVIERRQREPGNTSTETEMGKDVDRTKRRRSMVSQIEARKRHPDVGS